MEDKGKKETAVPIIYPSYRMKDVQYYVEGTEVSYNQKTGMVTAKERGNAAIFARDSLGRISAELKITVKDISNLTEAAGNYSDLYHHKGTWWYLKNGYIQKNILVL